MDSGLPQTLVWTPPYKFFTSQQLGITAASQWPDPSRENEYYVVAFDVLLTNISGMTMRLGSGTNGKAFILGGDGRVIGVPDYPQLNNPATLAASVLTPAESFPVSMVSAAYTEWVTHGRPSGEPFVFTTGKSAWWASFWHYASGKQSLWLVVAVPEGGYTSASRRSELYSIGSDSRLWSVVFPGLGCGTEEASRWNTRRDSSQ